MDQPPDRRQQLEDGTLEKTLLWPWRIPAVNHGGCVELRVPAGDIRGFPLFYCRARWQAPAQWDPKRLDHALASAVRARASHTGTCGTTQLLWAQPGTSNISILTAAHATWELQTSSSTLCSKHCSVVENKPRQINSGSNLFAICLSKLPVSCSTFFIAGCPSKAGGGASVVSLGLLVRQARMG